MKILVLSDIHGQNDILKPILDFFQKERYDRLFLLGDITRNSIPLLNEFSEVITAVKGNCDDKETVDEASFLMPDYTLAREFQRVFFLTHGHLYNEYAFSDLYDVFLSGHTHHPLLRRNGEDKIIANPGSISRPRDSLPSFISIDEEGLKLYDVNTMSIYDTLDF